MKVIIPESLNDIKLFQYQKWLKVSDQNDDQNFLKQKMIEIFCDIPLRDVLNIRTSDVDQIVDDINNVFQQKPKFIDRFDYDDKRFGFIPKLDDISFGEYVDLDNYLPDWESMGKAMCVLFVWKSSISETILSSSLTKKGGLSISRMGGRPFSAEQVRSCLAWRKPMMWSGPWS